MGSFFTGGGATARDVWEYASRTLTQSKFPFWSAIITQTQGSGTVSASSSASVSIQPPADETWLVWIDFYVDAGASGSYALYTDYDGTTLRYHRMVRIGGTYGLVRPGMGCLKILTNTLYGRLYVHNYEASAVSFYYGYSGFKLSQPIWSPRRLDPTPPKPFKLKTDLPLPDPIKALDKYKALILGLDPTKSNEYALGIILEEDTPLAIDEKTGFVVERKSAYVKADVLADMILKFKSGAIDYVKAGYESYLKKWKAEGIDLGVL